MVVCLGTQKFVDYLCMTTPCVLSVMHYSLLELAYIKEKHDSVKCRQGDIVGMPCSSPPLDVVFINCLPALNHSLPRILDAVVRRCVPGKLLRAFLRDFRCAFICFRWGYQYIFEIEYDILHLVCIFIPTIS